MTDQTAHTLTRAPRARAAFTFAVTLLFLCLAAPAAPAQEPSTDRRNPTPLTSSSVEGEYDGDAAVHYYRFVAGKGDVKTTLTAKTQRYSVNVDVELLDENSRQLEKLWVTANEAGRTMTNTHRFVRRQPVVIKVTLPADTDIKHLKYEIDLAGAVELDGAASPNGSTPATAMTTGGTQAAPASGDRLCLPTAGMLVLTTAAGESYEIDLSQITKAIIKK